MSSSLDAPDRRVKKRPSDQDLQNNRVAPRAETLENFGDAKAALLSRNQRRNLSTYVEKDIRQRVRNYCCQCRSETGVDGHLGCTQCLHSRTFCVDCLTKPNSSGD
jgi:hypothetical protein